MDNTVGVDIEFDFDLGNAAGCRGNIVQREAAESFVVRGHGSFTLKYMDLNGGLVIGRSREDLALGSGNGGISFDQSGVDAAEGFNTEGKRRYIEEENVFDFAA